MSAREIGDDGFSRPSIVAFEKEAKKCYESAMSDGGKKYDTGKPRWSLLTKGMEHWTGVHGRSGEIPMIIKHGPLCERWHGLTQRWGDPNDFLAGVVRVLTHGAAKYGDHNWKLVEYERYYDAYRRHLDAGWFAGGKCYDEDTDEHHLLHAGACVLIMYGLKEGEKDEG